MFFANTAPTFLCCRKIDMRMFSDNPIRRYAQLEQNPFFSVACYYCAFLCPFLYLKWQQKREQERPKDDENRRNHVKLFFMPDFLNVFIVSQCFIWYRVEMFFHPSTKKAGDFLRLRSLCREARSALSAGLFRRRGLRIFGSALVHGIIWKIKQFRTWMRIDQWWEFMH